MRHEERAWVNIRLLLLLLLLVLVDVRDGVELT